MVAVVSLLVIGPERLPKAARVAGYWLGKVRGTIASVKAEIREELREEEVRQALQQHQEDMDAFQHMLEDAADVKNSLTSSDAIVSDKKNNADGKQ